MLERTQVGARIFGESHRCARSSSTATRLLDGDDVAIGLKRYTPRIGTELETQVVGSLRPSIHCCDREVTSVAVSLPKEARGFERALFKETNGGRIKRVMPSFRAGVCPPRSPLDRRLRDGDSRGCADRLPTFAAFGAGGTETLVLGQLLSTLWRDLFRELVLSNRMRLVLATFRVPESVPYPYLRYDLDELEPRIVADVSLESDAMAV